MTSRAKIAANRRNAARSTGPRTEKGKARSRRNRFSHGLSVPEERTNACLKQIEALADMLTALSGSPPEIARSVAQASFELLRVRQSTVETINSHCQEQDSSCEEDISNETRLRGGLSASLLKLVASDRYERRARSKLNKALRFLEVTSRDESAFPMSHLKYPRHR
jgi:hypothetical protein